MSTRSRIGFISTDNSIETVYCHQDGYPAFNGRILKECYSGIEKIKELLAQGDMSSLGETIKECVFFHRDRNEVLEPAYKEKDYESFKSDLSWDIEWVYLWDESINKWRTYKAYGDVDNRKIKETTGEDV